MDKSSYSNSNQPQNISEDLKEYINAMVEEIVLNGKDFEKHKKWLEKYSESEGINYPELEQILTDFFELLDDYKKVKSSALKIVLLQKGRLCLINEDVIEKCTVIPDVQKVSEKKLDKIYSIAGRFLTIAVALLEFLKFHDIIFYPLRYSPFIDTSLFVYGISLFLLCKYFKNKELKKTVNALYVLICVAAVEVFRHALIAGNIISIFEGYLLRVLVSITTSIVYMNIGISCLKKVNSKDLKIFGRACIMLAIYYILDLIIVLFKDFYDLTGDIYIYMIWTSIGIVSFIFVLYTQFKIFSNAKTSKT
jgi:hypothetical protein